MFYVFCSSKNIIRKLYEKDTTNVHAVINYPKA